MTIISIPQAVWYDALDPRASGMAEEIGLPEPRFVKSGRGGRYVYADITREQAEEVAEYIGDRAEMLLGQGGFDRYDPDDQRARNTYRAAVKAAERIREALNG